MTGKRGHAFSVAFSGLYAAMSPPVASSLATASFAAARAHAIHSSAGLRYDYSYEIATAALWV